MDIKQIIVQKLYSLKLYRQLIQSRHTTPTDKIIKNTKTKTTKNEPKITDKKFPRDFETSSNISENAPSPTNPVNTDNTLNPNEKNITNKTGVKILKIIIIIEHKPIAFFIKIEQLYKKSKPSET